MPPDPGPRIQATGLPDRRSSLRLGLDMYSLRSQGMTPFEQLDFCAKHFIKVVHFSEVRLIGGLEPEHLRRVREHADALGIDLEIGMLSICPSSTRFDASRGTAEEQLIRMIDAARLVRSPIVRCVLGAIADRLTPGGIESRIADTVKVLRNVRSRVVDADLKIAVENHAGDMQARELKALVEEAGRDFVGVCIDAGNALWAMEDPHLTLETLAPYVLTSHTRDSAVRRTAQGVEVAWTRMGGGNVRIGEYLRTFVEKCPGRPLSLEIVIMPAPRLLAFREPRFWEAYRSVPAWEFERFLELVDQAAPVTLPEGPVDAAQELEHVEASIRWTQNALGIGKSA
jgi:sugar phosphate isomerase/epimerase